MYGCVGPTKGFVPAGVSGGNGGVDGGNGVPAGVPGGGMYGWVGVVGLGTVTTAPGDGEASGEGDASGVVGFGLVTAPGGAAGDGAGCGVPGGSGNATIGTPG